MEVHISTTKNRSTHDTAHYTGTMGKQTCDEEKILYENPRVNASNIERRLMHTTLRTMPVPSSAGRTPAGTAEKQ